MKTLDRVSRTAAVLLIATLALPGCGADAPAASTGVAAPAPSTAATQPADLVAASAASNAVSASNAAPAPNGATPIATTDPALELALPQVTGGQDDPSNVPAVPPGPWIRLSQSSVDRDPTGDPAGAREAGDPASAAGGRRSDQPSAPPPQPQRDDAFAPPAAPDPDADRDDDRDDDRDAGDREGRDRDDRDRGDLHDPGSDPREDSPIPGWEDNPSPEPPPGLAQVNKFRGHAATWGDWCDEGLPLLIEWVTTNAVTVTLETDIATYTDLPQSAENFPACSMDLPHWIKLTAAGGGISNSLGKPASLVPW